MHAVGQAEFAEEIQRRMVWMSQRDVSVLSGVHESTIQQLLQKKAAAPRTGRKTAIALADAVGWPIDDALETLGLDPLTDHERQRLESTDVLLDRLHRLLPELTKLQLRRLVDLVASMVLREPVTGAEPAKRGVRRTHRGLRMTPDPDELIMPPEQRDGNS